jgi:hypothetical protein
MGENVSTAANTSKDINIQSSHDQRWFWLAIATTGGAVVVNIGYEKYAVGVPDWLFILLCLIVLSIWFYWIWTHEKVKEYRRVIYNHPIMSLAFMAIVGALIGCCISALLWWSIYRQPQFATILDQTETQTAKPQSNIELKQEVTKFISSLYNFDQRMEAVKSPDLFYQQEEDYLAAKTVEEKRKVSQR